MHAIQCSGFGSFLVCYFSLLSCRSWSALVYRKKNCSSMEADSPHDYYFKLILVGNANVGKTCLVRQFLKVSSLSVCFCCLSSVHALSRLLTVLWLYKWHVMWALCNGKCFITINVLSCDPGHISSRPRSDNWCWLHAQNHWDWRWKNQSKFFSVIMCQKRLCCNLSSRLCYMKSLQCFPFWIWTSWTFLQSKLLFCCCRAC